MKKFVAFGLALLVSTAFANPAFIEEPKEIHFTPSTTTVSGITDDKPIVVAAGCMLKGERTSGMNKICYYKCLGGERAITIGATELCPLSL